jgi:DNA-binding NarL/FixJ family response regulator
MKSAFDAILLGKIWAERHITDNLLTEVLASPSGSNREDGVMDCKLSPREMEILQAMAFGLSNLEIAQKLFLSEKTVKTHVYRMFKKMNVGTRTQAVMKAVKSGFI